MGIFDTDEDINEIAMRLAQKTHACAICCGVCFWSIVATFAICANITAMAGLSHTQRIVLDPLCPPGYWESSISLLFIRFAVFCLVVFTIVCSTKIQGVCCFISITILAMITILSVAISDSVVTSQAISALNCSTALRAERDNDPLLIVSGSMFIMIDWLLCLCVCCTCCTKYREREQVTVDED